MEGGEGLEDTFIWDACADCGQGRVIREEEGFVGAAPDRRMCNSQRREDGWVDHKTRHTQHELVGRTSAHTVPEPGEHDNASVTVYLCMPV